jgi:hypothetical protein
MGIRRNPDDDFSFGSSFGSVDESIAQIEASIIEGHNMGANDDMMRGLYDWHAQLMKAKIEAAKLSSGWMIPEHEKEEFIPIVELTPEEIAEKQAEEKRKAEESAALDRELQKRLAIQKAKKEEAKRIAEIEAQRVSDEIDEAGDLLAELIL